MMAKATDFVNLDVGSLSCICTGRPKSCFTLKVSPAKITLPPHGSLLQQMLSHQACSPLAPDALPAPAPVL